MFKALKQHAVSSESTAWFPVPEAGHPDAAIEVRSANEVNKPYHNSTVRSTVKRARRLNRGTTDAGDLKQAREEDRKLFPMHVIVGFRKIPDDAKPGTFIPYSREAAEEFCRVCPWQIFDPLREFAGDPESFYMKGSEVEDTPIGPGDEPEVAELAENSEAVSSGS
jgi:hypothetical protein